MTGFNLADLFESVVDAVPDRTAVVGGEVRRTFAELDERANRFARYLQFVGVEPGERIAILAWNRVEWVEVLLACFKVRVAPVNVNYRYVDAEVHHVLGDAGCTTVVAEADFVPMIERIADSLPALRRIVTLDGDYEDVLALMPSERDFPQRSGDDRSILYTGGTTGMPKGVVWRQEDLFFAGLGGGNPGGPPIEAPGEIADLARQDRPPMLVTSPLMHGSGQWNMLVSLLAGWGAVLWTGRHFDAAAVAVLAEAEGVGILVLVGDGMGRPFADHLADADHAYDFSRLGAVVSGGAPMSPVVKKRLAAALPISLILDGFGSSESGTSGFVDGGAPAEGPPRFRLDDNTTVLDADLRPVAPGSGEVGMIARRGHLPLGYLGDPEKTAATFPTDADGVRWAIPGDHGRPEADGTITLLGRGSRCINTGGEKVFPEEVETAVKSHPAIVEAVVVGLPDERFGQRVTAVVVLAAGTTLSVEELQEHLRPRLAGYKLPRALVTVESIQYTGPGKPDHVWAREVAAAS